MQVLLTAAYDGTGYAGWQRQKNGLAVQQAMEDVLSGLLNEKIVLRAASRTDAGVHALGQRAAFKTDCLKIPLNKLPAVLNGLLPGDISVTAAEEAPDVFNPRHAENKTYRYQIDNATYPNPLISRYSAFVSQALDIEKMRDAAVFFIGKHDFKAFQASSNENDLSYEKSSVREIYECKIEMDEVSRLITLIVTGNGFLYNMVRIVAGTVLYAGLGKIEPDGVPDIILSKDRTRAGKTMPPEGLILMEVRY
jgi:tRNA pseudouridine38-40 synthase